MLKEKKRFYILLTIICLSILGINFLLFSQKSQATSNITYSFVNETLYNNTLPEPISTFNVRNETLPTGLFDGTFSFTEDTGNPDDWTTSEGASTSIDVISDFEGHDYVLETNDWGGSSCSTYTTFTGQGHGTVSFWFLISGTSATRAHDFEISNGGIADANNLLRIILDSNDIRAQHNSGTDTLITDLSSNTWYYVEIEFCSDLSGYKDLSADDFRVIINGEIYGDYDFMYAHATADRIAIETWGGSCATDEEVYWDGFLFSWDTNFEEYDNLKEEYETTNNIETDKFEFAFDEDGIILGEGEDNVLGWTDIENDGYVTDAINIMDSEEAIDKAVFFNYTDGSYSGISQDFENNTDICFNISWQWDFNEFGGGNGNNYVFTEIYSYDETLLYKLRINAESIDMGDSYPWEQTTIYDISYYDGSDYQELWGNQGSKAINYYQNFNFSIWWFKGHGIIQIEDDTYEINPIVPSKTGLGTVKFLVENTASVVTNYGEMFLDYVKILGDYDSLSPETTPENIYNLDITWNQDHYPFFAISYNSSYTNNLAIWINGIDELINCSNFLIFNNKSFGNIYKNCYLQIFNNTSFEILNIAIYGFYLSDGTNKFYPDMNFINIIANNSYFYTSNSYLYWNLETDDLNQEFIEISFNINQSTYQYSSFFTQYNSHDYGDCYTRFKMIDNSNITFIANSHLTNNGKRFEYDKTIEEIIIRIDDNDYYSNTNITGYISPILFRYSYTSPTLISDTLLGGLAIMIIIVILPLFLFYLFGKRKLVLIGSLVLITIIAIIGEVIPSWVLFIVILFLVSFYKSEKLNENTGERI